MAKKQVVLGVFADEAAADAAAQSLKDWDKLDDDVKLHAIGVLVLDSDGKVKTHKLGRRAWGKGAGIGVVLAALLPPTLIAGALVTDDEASAVAQKLGELGGDTHVLNPSDEAVAEVDAVAPRVDEAVAAEGDTSPAS